MLGEMFPAKSLIGILFFALLNPSSALAAVALSNTRGANVQMISNKYIVELESLSAAPSLETPPAVSSVEKFIVVYFRLAAKF